VWPLFAHLCGGDVLGEPEVDELAPARELLDHKVLGFDVPVGKVVVVQVQDRAKEVPEEGPRRLLVQALLAHCNGPADHVEKVAPLHVLDNQHKTMVLGVRSRLQRNRGGSAGFVVTSTCW